MKTRSALVAAIVAALAVCAVLPAAGTAKRARHASLKITKLTVLNNRIGVRGKVSLPRPTASRRRATRVVFVLTGSAGREKFKAKLNRRRGFKVSHTSASEGTVT